MRSETMSASQCQLDIDATSTGGGIGGKARADSPLDFSTKKKFKPEPLRIERRESSSVRPRSESTTSADTLPDDNPESPCSRLRNILSMKSPMISEDMPGTVLNLSKVSPFPMLWCKSESPQLSSNSANSNSCSPPLSEHHHPPAFPKSRSSSPRPPAVTIPLSNGCSTPTLVRPTTGDVSENGGVGRSRSSKNDTSTISFPSWGSGVYSPSISPLMSQTVPAHGGGLQLPFETSPTLFPHHMVAGAGSPIMQFPHGLSLPLSSNGSSAGTKGRVTRPFKAYPKDPLSFTSPGLYGLSLGAAAPAPGTTDAGIHQSNQAYAEFRKQMLSTSQFGKARRGGISHRNNSPYPSMDPMDDHISDSGSMMRANDSGSASDDGGNSLMNGKNRHGKTEQQMKDEAYWERRRKNNEAAKRSRDARRAKEDEIAIRAAFLEQENLKLRFEVCALKSETAKLRCMLYSTS